ncbi:histidine phosphatase family protein [Trinickia caryophylli]|uniref:Alpha-ribazole phosphatase n=1 Tax=Trinickia caryophylli TaxID=28094 RepID=A0A1X7GXW4_TRICW|nr:histidine phosphatase family protein [Trinickia caryophylli]PMS10156.1 alpha-ribazole phosphatase [Trinickia caryophylli]TRX18256.1 alpha-ribazole phosphatase [Trinickia caryophylli]WQE10958.1 histidine phosphatase family protein [Trinickia caryophylli]SMF76259.1 alpha-ribazole phosphatase [Trinickia caryophylli]GLU35435.1 phosphoglycerate mutase [Trinickia caryophylli]
MDLVLIRHPPPAVEEGVCYGCTDLPLAGAPDAAADAFVARLALLGAPSPQTLLTSPLVRCAGVAAELGKRLGLLPGTDARLREIDFGAWEGRRWGDIDRAALDAWAADLHHARAHGGESVAQCSARVAEWFEACRALAAGSAWVLTHAGVMRIVAARALSLPLEQTLSWPVGMGGIVWLRGGRDEMRWQLVRWNA